MNDSLTTIDALHTYFNDKALSDAIIELQQSYYGKKPNQWSGSNLLNAIQALDKHKRSKSARAEMVLNP